MLKLHNFPYTKTLEALKAKPKNIKTMKKIFYFSILIFIGCKNRTNSEINIHKNDNVEIANKFIDAFYSFNEDSLKLSLSYAEKSHPSILYYQK
ncbi:MAG: hypothetical protein ACI8ZX_001386, partial [Planctomycetota bacterium]